MQDYFSKLSYFLTQLTRQLFNRSIQTSLGFGIYHVHYSLCFNHIYSSTEKGSLSEFPWLCRTNSPLDQKLHNSPNYIGATMQIYLHRILCCICMWSLHDKHYRFIDSLVSIYHLAIRRSKCTHFGKFLFAHKNTIANTDGRRATYSYHSDG